MVVTVNSNLRSDGRDRRLGADNLRCLRKLFFGIGFLESFPASDPRDVMLISNEGGRRRLSRNKRKAVGSSSWACQSIQGSPEGIVAQQRTTVCRGECGKGSRDRAGSCCAEQHCGTFGRLMSPD
jgi:hypothetical protein